MDLFFTEIAAEFLGDAQEFEKDKVVNFLAVRSSNRTPFMIGRDGDYVTDVNRWLRGLASNGVRSAESWEAYARDAKDWCSFLEASGVGIWDVSEDDFERYHRFRRLTENSVSAASWVRITYALDRLYRWALGQQLIRAMPFDRQRMHEKGAQHENIRFVSRASYMTWRDVGFRGMLPNGHENLQTGVSNVERNSVFADLLVTTGLRCKEGTYALLTERPVRSGNPLVRQERWRVPQGLAKGSRQRHTLAPVTVLRALDDYVDFERKLQVKEARARGEYEGSSWILLSRATADRGWLADGSGHIDLSRAGPEKRSKLLLLSGGRKEPLMIFLTANGWPVSQRTWESLFVRATERCLSAGVNVNVTPHILRHTFATWTLTRYLKQHMRANADGGGSYKAYLLAPVRRLMRLMGHSSPMTTFKYLDMVGDVPELLDEALDDYGLILPDLLHEEGTREYDRTT